MLVTFARFISVVSAQFQPRIACKIKQINGENFDCTLCDPWIEPLLKHKLISLNQIKRWFFPSLV
jgi:hypothetical protein